MKKFLLTLALITLGWFVFAQEDEDPPLDPPTRPMDITPYNPIIDKSPLKWWNDTVWYEVYVRSFYDSNGDGIGDIKGITKKLDYLNDGNPGTKTDLGITGLWLMPIFDSKQDHGYDVIDFTKVKKDYGTLEDFKELITESHKRGIKVILDIPFNHVSNQHPWFLAAASDEKSPYRDYFRWADTPLQPAGPDKRPCWHPIKTKNGRDWFYYGVFNFALPDLNLTNPKVTEEIKKVVQFWVDQGIDGFRLDAVKYFVETGDELVNTPETYKWLGDFYKYYKALNPNLFTVGEAWTSLSAIRKYTGDKVDIGLNFPVQLGLISAFKDMTKESLEDNLFATSREFPNSQWGTFLSNHDQDRFLTTLGGDLRRGKLGALVLLTAPGVPYLYYGEEIGMKGNLKPSDLDVRRPFQWTTDGAPGYGFSTGKPYGKGITNPSKENNAQAMQADNNSLWSRYRDLITLRSKYSSLVGGKYIPLETNRPRIMAYLRSDEKSNILVILNLSGFKYEDYTLHLWNGPLKPGVKPATLLGDKIQGSISPLTINKTGGFDSWVPLKSIDPFSSYVFELK